MGFLCNWCSYRAADLAGSARIKYAPNVRIIRVMCSGRVDPTFVFKALADGADGVMIAGCHPGECHYIEQNYKAMRRFAMLKHTLTAMGVEPEPRAVGLGLGRRRAAPGRAPSTSWWTTFAGSVRSMAGQLAGGRRAGWRPCEEIVQEHAEAMEVPR